MTNYRMPVRTFTDFPQAPREWSTLFRLQHQSHSDFSARINRSVPVPVPVPGDPAVLFFDEATSALDNATEHAVMDAIHNLAGEKTIILVAHRLSTVKPCDRIYVLEQGSVVDSGSWDELSGQSATFQRLAAGVS